MDGFKGLGQRQGLICGARERVSSLIPRITIFSCPKMAFPPPPYVLHVETYRLGLPRGNRQKRKATTLEVGKLLPQNPRRLSQQSPRHKVSWGIVLAEWLNKMSFRGSRHTREGAIIELQPHSKWGGKEKDARNPKSFQQVMEPWTCAWTWTSQDNYTLRTALQPGWGHNPSVFCSWTTYTWTWA